MYVGRFIVVGSDVAAYRVSSRSFPNRQVVDRDGTLSVVPTEDAPATDNPYVSYNCLRTTDDGAQAVVGNGSHVDPIVEKLDLGYPARDAVVTGLHAMDYEKDDYNTPRIAGVLDEDGAGVIGTVTHDALVVETVTEPTLVATYEENRPTAYELDATRAAEAARAVYDADFEHAVCAAAVSRTATGFDTAIANE
jgi:IMP cyclohydrolase